VSVYLLDSSALVKRYVTELGSAWIRRITEPSARNHIIVARITWVEMLSALARRQREGTLSSADVSQVIQNLRYDFDVQYQVAEVNRQLVDRAGDLVLRHPLRAYDAVQLAAAVHIHAALTQAGATSPVFVSADDKLVAAAQVEGLAAENPNLYST
jgi:predicted nucleic acid-binding protein